MNTVYKYNDTKMYVEEDFDIETSFYKHLSFYILFFCLFFMVV